MSTVHDMASISFELVREFLEGAFELVPGAFRASLEGLPPRAARGLELVEPRLRRRSFGCLYSAVVCRVWSVVASGRDRRLVAGQNLSQLSHWDRKDHSVPGRLNQADGDLERAGAEHAPSGPDLVGDVPAQLDVERFHRPCFGIEEKAGDLTNHLSVGSDYLPSTNVLIR
jgi:hypothetical protein